MDDCIFCRIVRKEIPAKVALETERVLAFYDINAVAPTHLLLIPKKHVINITDPDLPADKELAAEIFSAVQKLAAEEGLTVDGFRVVANCGPNAGEAVHHLHFHILGGRKLNWPPG